MKGYSDLGSLPENDRIKIIGEAIQAGNFVGVALEDDPEKIARYIEKLTDRFPDVRHVSTEPGPVAKTVVVGFSPKADT